MEDFFKKYIEIERIINDACECIASHNSSQLGSEISLIKDTLSKITVNDNWQDSVGDAVAKIIDSFTSSLGQIENSIFANFATSEKIYLKLKIQLQQLKSANTLYKSHVLKKPFIDPSYENNNDSITKYELWKKQLDNYKKRCEKLSELIDNNLKKLNEINEMSVLSSPVSDVPSFNFSVSSLAKNINHIGVFFTSAEKGLYGSIISGIDGKKHSIFNQGQINGWGTNCNRAAAASIASGFTNDPWSTISEANRTGDGIGYKTGPTNAYFSKFGLSASVREVNNNYDTVKSDIITSLENGSLVMFDLSQSGVRGASGQKWTGQRHWVAILDKRVTNDGSYEIFVSDSGHGGSVANHGYGEGWYKVDEFNGLKVARVTTITPKEKEELFENSDSSIKAV